MLAIRLSPALRTNLRVALIPLGVTLVARGLAELERQVEAGLTRLADVENRVAARELVLGRLDDDASRNGTWEQERQSPNYVDGVSGWKFHKHNAADPDDVCPGPECCSDAAAAPA